MTDNKGESTQSSSRRMGMRGSTVKGFLLALLLGGVAGMLVGGGSAVWYHRVWRRMFVSAVKDIHFLIRENDAQSAKAALEKHAPYFDRQMTDGQISRLAEELRRAARRHVE